MTKLSLNRGQIADESYDTGESRLATVAFAEQLCRAANPPGAVEG